VVVVSGSVFEPDEATEASMIAYVQRVPTPLTPAAREALRSFAQSNIDDAVSLGQSHSEVGPNLIASFQRDRDKIEHAFASGSDQDLKNAVSDSLTDWGQMMDVLGVKAAAAGELYNVLHGLAELTNPAIGISMPTLEGRGPLDDVKAALESGGEGVGAVVEAGKRVAAAAAKDAEGFLGQLLDVLKSIGWGVGVTLGVVMVGGIAYVVYRNRGNR